MAKEIEAIASVFGICSVVLGILKYVWVYPVGMISTIAYIFIMAKAKLYGDCLVNIIYTTVSAYGWYQWSQSATSDGKVSVRKATLQEKLFGLVACLVGAVVIGIIYWAVGQELNWLDMLSSSMFAVAMWFMALQCLESWVLWFIGDVLSVAKVLENGLYLTSIQYLILTFMAIWGWFEWYNGIEEPKEPGDPDSFLA